MDPKQKMEVENIRGKIVFKEKLKKTCEPIHQKIGRLNREYENNKKTARNSSIKGRRRRHECTILTRKLIFLTVTIKC